MLAGIVDKIKQFATPLGMTILQDELFDEILDHNPEKGWSETKYFLYYTVRTNGESTLTTSGEVGVCQKRSGGRILQHIFSKEHWDKDKAWEYLEGLAEKVLKSHPGHAGLSGQWGGSSPGKGAIGQAISAFPDVKDKGARFIILEDGEYEKVLTQHLYEGDVDKSRATYISESRAELLRQIHEEHPNIYPQGVPTPGIYIRESALAGEREKWFAFDGKVKNQTYIPQHEYSHAWDVEKGFSSSEGWQKAMRADSKVVQRNPVQALDPKIEWAEDFAVAVPAYLSFPEQFAKMFPNRKEFLDSILPVRKAFKLRFEDMEPVKLSEINDEDLSEDHDRLHRYYAEWLVGEHREDDDWSYGDLLQKHAFVVAELKKRGRECEHDDELAKPIRKSLVEMIKGATESFVWDDGDEPIRIIIEEKE